MAAARIPLTPGALRSHFPILLAGLLAGVSAGAARPPGEPPAVSEHVEVRLVQLAVAVVDPKAGTRASVPGLGAEQFVVLVDGHPLSGDARKRLAVDEICAHPGDSGGRDGGAPPVPSRTLIGVVDFNYLDARTRHLVADGLDSLADEGLPPGVRIKLYGLTRQVRRITPGFVDAPDALRRAAREIRGEFFSRKPAAELGGLPEGATNAGAPLNEPFGSDDAQIVPRPLAERLRSAFGSLAENDARQLEQAFGESIATDIWQDATSVYDPLASLAALEGIIRAHAALPGQKAVVLFTSNAFRIARQDVLADAIERMADLARRENVTIFTVDAEGLGGRSRRDSELLSSLAADSGGASVRRTGNLARGFAQAMEQLSCYYLLSVPVPAEPGRTSRHTLAVRLDTERFPDLWGLSVRAPTSLVLPSRDERRREERLAVLFSPEDFSDPPLDVLIEYPRTFAGRDVMPVRFRVPLSALTWRPIPGGREAHVLFEGLVERDRGRGADIVCRAGMDEAGALILRRRGTAPPPRDTGLVFEIFCAFRRDGLYTARGVLTDLVDERSGGGRSTAIVRRAAGGEWHLDELRLLVASGRDLLWRNGWKTARQDTGHRAFFVAGSGEAVGAEDRLRFDGVLCGPGTGPEGLPRAALLRKTGDGGMSAYQGFPVPASLVEAAAGPGPFCAPYVLDIEEFTLEPGSYALRIALPDGRTLAERRFEVR